MDRRTLFLSAIIMALVVLAGCGGAGDPLDVDLDLSESCGEEHVRQIDGSCLRICPEGQIDVDDVCTDIPGVEEDVSGGPPPAAGKSTKVKIISTDVITGCVYQVSRCGGKLAASGGSKSYVWKVISGSLPEGMKFEPPAKDAKNTSKALISGTPTKMTGTNSPVTIKIGVEDAKDAAKRAEVSFSFTVTDKLNVSLYQAMLPDAEPLRLVNGKSDALELDYKAILQATVVGKSAEYTWKLDAAGAKCFKDADAKNADECKGSVTGKLNSTSTIGGKLIPTSFFISPSGDNYRGYRFENLVITVANKTGDKNTITIPSVVFKKDPCSQPLVVSSTDYDKSGSVKRIVAINNEFEEVTFKVSGGRSPYTWKIAGEGGPDSVALDLTKEESPPDDDSEFTISSMVVPTVSLTWRKLMERPKLNYRVHVSDSCKDPQRVGLGTISIEVTDTSASSLGDVRDLRAEIVGGVFGHLQLWSGLEVIRDVVNVSFSKEISFEKGESAPIIHINRINLTSLQWQSSLSKFKLYSDHWIMQHSENIAALRLAIPITSTTNLIQYMKGYPPKMAEDCRTAYKQKNNVWNPQNFEDKEELIACMLAGVPDIWYYNTTRAIVSR